MLRSRCVAGALPVTASTNLQLCNYIAEAALSLRRRLEQLQLPLGLANILCLWWSAPQMPPA